MPTYQFKIPIIPVAKGRARFNKKGFAYTPTKTRKAEQDIRFFISQQYKGKPLEGPLIVTMSYIFLRPKSVKRALHTVKPDCSNLLKCVEDAGNGLLWRDDKQIWMITMSKCYGEESSIYIDVTADPQ